MNFHCLGTTLGYRNRFCSTERFLQKEFYSVNCSLLPQLSFNIAECSEERFGCDIIFCHWIFMWFLFSYANWDISSVHRHPVSIRFFLWSPPSVVKLRQNGMLKDMSKYYKMPILLYDSVTIVICTLKWQWRTTNLEIPSPTVDLFVHSSRNFVTLRQWHSNK